MTRISICWPLWPNLSVSTPMARADSESGSWNPPGDRLLATGMPKTAAARKTSTPSAMIRRGAAMATRAIFCSIVSPSAAGAPHCAGRWIVRDNLTNANFHASNSVLFRDAAGRCHRSTAALKPVRQ
ncbi:mmpL domain protein [Mycobacterium avium subsp. avium 2285 (R)]|nr:mmpL domain protein [Mycobacterium avium subsp. avium 2285 (R)]